MHILCIISCVMSAVVGDEDLTSSVSYGVQVVFIHILSLYYRCFILIRT